jgi:hypothetical protein
MDGDAEPKTHWWLTTDAGEEEEEHYFSRAEARKPKKMTAAICL